jgi:hypothetical protein
VVGVVVSFLKGGRRMEPVAEPRLSKAPGTGNG